MVFCRGESSVSAGVMEELLAEVNLCSGAGAADRLAADQRDLLIQVGKGVGLIGP